MTLTDLLFVFFFLPLALIVYHMGMHKIRPYVLLLISLFFYALGDMKYFIVMFFSLLISIGAGWCLSRATKKLLKLFLLVFGIGYNVALLCCFKYVNFAVLNINCLFHTNIALRSILLPLGISVFTFKAISYLVDIYHEKIQIGRNPVYSALYLSFFGQIQSGPISRYNQMWTANAMKGSWDMFTGGVYRFVQGFNKKILLADILNHVTQEVFDNTFVELSAPLAWFGAICYSLELFFDFSGYSDMAIGIGQMFGISCPDNFRYPYMAQTVSEFWRRWHITLGAWFRDYIYIPLGGSRVDRQWKLYRNLLIVWVLTGLWHGGSWNFIFWGLGNGIMVILEKMLKLPERLKHKSEQIAWRTVTLLFVVFQWVIFRANGLKSGLSIIKAMIFNWNYSLSFTRAWILFQDNKVFLLAGILLSIPLLPWLKQRTEKDKIWSVIWNAGQILVTGGLFLLAMSCVIVGQNNPFTYTNF